MLSHLDPAFLAIMDDTRARLERVFLAPDGSPALAVSGTGTTAMETAVANLVAPGTRVLSIVTGYFAERLAEICRRMVAPPSDGSTSSGDAQQTPMSSAASSPRREPISSPLSTPRHQPGC